MISPTSASASPFVYHAAPLHYMPHIIARGALYAKSVLSAQGITPRAGAVRRDRMLGLADWVHLSLRPDTPLLRDKLGRGYPHVLLVFRRAEVLSLPEVALLPYNTKVWRSRAALAPVTDPQEKAALLKRRLETKRFPSLEVLVHYGLSLTLLAGIAFATESERAMTAETLNAVSLICPSPMGADPALFPLPERYEPVTGAAIQAYFAACRESRALLPPPLLPFD